MEKFLTTGEAAEICRVSVTTIIREFDAGRFKTNRNGSGLSANSLSGRRMLTNYEVKLFLARTHPPSDRIHFPILLEDGKPRVLVVDSSNIGEDEHIVTHTIRACNFHVEQVHSSFEAGVTVCLMLPSVVVVNLDGPKIDLTAIWKQNKDNYGALPRIKTVAMSTCGKEIEVSGQYDAVIRDPTDSDHVSSTLNAAIRS